jgi:hypothetical protein
VPPPCIEHVASRFTVLLGVRLSLLRDGSGFLFQRLESPLLALDGGTGIWVAREIRAGSLQWTVADIDRLAHTLRDS